MLVSEGVKHIMAPVHGVSQHVEPKEHGLVCDVLPHGLIDDNLCPEENPLQAIVHGKRRWLRVGDLVDNEIYRPRGQVTQDRRKEKFHLGFSGIGVEHGRKEKSTSMFPIKTPW
jgi:hypothetical protein